jgi:hypothetical protein
MIAGALAALGPRVDVVTAVVAAAAELDLGAGLLTYGPLGLMVAGFMFGQIIPGPTHKRVVEENDRLRGLIDDKVWPTINDATAAIKDSTDTIRDVIRRMPPPPAGES